MRIAVNASLLDDRPTGLGVYTWQMIVSLSKVCSAEELTIYTSVPEIFAPVVGGSRLRRISPRLQPRHGPAAAAARLAWTQTVFPVTARGNDVLYNPTHHGVLWRRGAQIVTVHDLLPLRFPSQYRMQHVYFKTVLPRLLKSASAVVADSEHTRMDIHRFHGTPLQKIRVVHCGVDHIKFRPTRDVDVKERYGLERYVLAVGASYPHKNVIRALGAFARAKRSLPDLQFALIAGPSDYLEDVKRYVVDAGLTDVKVLGYVDHHDLPRLYASAAAFIYPSLYEGFGLPPLEAMVHGCPAIVSRASSLPEVCGVAAYYIDPLDVDDMARAITTVVQNRGLQDDLRVKGARRAALFTWDNAAKQLYALLQEFASTAPASHRAALA